MLNIQSNIIKGEYKDQIISKTLNEILEGIRSVYGPFGTDIFIKKNGETYLTRDGKEVMESFRFDNELSIDILRILHQAVERQARIAGDGTTTLLIFYILLYKKLRENRVIMSNSTSIVRKRYKEIIQDILNSIKEKVVNITNDSEEFKSMIYTCTQDYDLVQKILNVMNYADKDTYTSVTRNDLDDELVITKNESPVLKGEKIYSTFPIPDTGELENSVILFVDGVLDITEEFTFRVLLQAASTPPMKRNFIILCSGTTESTRNAIVKLKETLRAVSPQEKGLMNNIIIYKLQGYLGYTKEMIQDISCIVYNEPEITGLVNIHNFETLIFKTFTGDIAWDACPIIYTLDIPPAHMDRIIYAFENPSKTQYDIKNGLRIYKEFNEKTKERLEELKKQIKDEKSTVRRNELIQRLKVLFGTFVEVSVGAKLLKDSQREYELILDAVVSSQAALKYGVIKRNSLLEAMKSTSDMMYGDTLSNAIADIIEDSLIETFAYLIHNKFKGMKYDDIVIFIDKMLNNDFSNIDVNLFNEMDSDSPNDIDKFHGVFKPSVMKVKDISVKVIEPFSIIENILGNSTVALDLALSEVFIIDSFMNNYI